MVLCPVHFYSVIVRPRLKRGTSGMIRYRYSAWDGSQDAFHPAPEDVLDSLADSLLQGGDLHKALRMLMQRGMTDRHNRVMPGLQDVLHRLRAMKEQQLRQYNPNRVLDDLRRQLDAIVARERQTLEAQLAATRQRLEGRRADTDSETAQQRANEARAVQEMEELVAERRTQLEALPRDVGETIRRLQQYDFLDQQARADFEALVQALQQQAMDTLWQSMMQRLHNMRPEDMQRLRHMLEDLNRLLEQREWGEEGDVSEFLHKYQDTLRLIEHLQGMERLADTLERVLWGADLQQINDEQVRQLMGEEAHGQVRAIKDLAEQLQQKGYVRKSKDRLELTARGIRQIAHKAMLDIFASMRRDQFGKHGAVRRGVSGQRLEETKAYVYGEPFDLHLVRTLMNAVLRTATQPPIRLAPQDFEVHGSEAVSRCSTVLLLDMSGSMERFSRFAAAKKVALALDALIRTQFPRDTLHIVGFFTYAQELKLEDLPYLTPKPFGFFPYMYSDMYHNSMGYLDLQIEAADAIAGRVDVPQAFTNIQAGLQVATHLLTRQHAANKQVILITDGEPTAHIRDRKICLEYPPSQRTLLETLKEVKRCTRQGITINTFMLGQDYYMERFVNELTKINRGRAFFTSPENIGDYILVDYLTNRRKKIA